MRALTRLQYREAILISIAMAVVAAIGWLVTPFWVAVAVAAQLAIGGIGAVWLIGPARTELGFARYATLATAGVTLTLFGRLLVPSIGLLLTPDRGAAAVRRDPPGARPDRRRASAGWASTWPWWASCSRPQPASAA